MELSAAQRTAMLAARRRLLADMGALMRQRERVVGLLAAAAKEPTAREELSLDVLACDGSAQVGKLRTVWSLTTNQAYTQMCT